MSGTTGRDRADALERRVDGRDRDRRALARALTVAEERERRRIAEGLHDHLGPVLAAAKLRLSRLSRLADPNELEREVESIAALLDLAMRSTRSLIFDLGSPVLREKGLYEAIRRFGEDLASRHDLRFRFVPGDGSEPPDGDLAVILFRTIRELLFNVVKHARATSAGVEVSRLDGLLRITVTDDGAGFDPETLVAGRSRKKTFGLLTAQDRLRRLGGRLEIESSPGGGTRIALTAPLAPGDAPGRRLRDR